MLVSEAITRLSQTELKQLKVRDDATAVMGYINEAILELHKRFNLWQDEAIITIEVDVTSYKLDGADTNVTIDLSDKILAVITGVYDPDGCVLYLNDDDDPHGAAVPKYNIVEFPADDIVENEEYSVIYRASPIDITDPVNGVIDLPPVLFEPMYFYVGFRAHVSQRGAKENENNTHFQRFLDSCNRVDGLGMVLADSVASHKFGYNNYTWP